MSGEMSEHVKDLIRRVDWLPARSTDAPALAAWFMDVDGVLNVIGPAPLGGWGVYARTGVMRGDGLMWPICYSPVLVQLLNALCRKRIVSFRWLTTWEHDAPKILAPALGLDLGRWIAGEDPGGGQLSASWWKLDIISENLAYPNEPFLIWTDDDIKEDLPARQLVDFLDPQRGMAICTDEKQGLSPQDFEQILGAIEARVRRE